MEVQATTRYARMSPKKMREVARTKEEAGIDALADAARGDREAEDLLRRFHARLREKGKA